MPKREERVNRWVDRWKSRLLLDSWGVTVKFPTENKEGQPVGEKTLADFTPFPTYTDCKLDIFPALFNEPISSQEATIVHELCHIITEPAREALALAVRKGVISEKKRVEIIEGLTEHFSKALFKAYKRKSIPDKSHYHV